MDFVKTLLIVSIATTLYYLLLQWPTEVVAVQQAPEEYNKDLIINDSKDSLTGMLSPMEEVVLKNEEPTKLEKVYEEFPKNGLSIPFPQLDVNINK